MSALMEQHETWSAARQRLWPTIRRAIKQPKRLAMERLIERVETPPPAKKPLFVSPVFSALPTATVFPNSPHWRAIAEQVCAKHGVTFKEMVSADRTRRIVVARHEAFYRIRNEVMVLGKPMTLPAIAQRFNRRDHTVVIHGIRKHQERMAVRVDELSTLKSQARSGVERPPK